MDFSRRTVLQGAAALTSLKLVNVRDNGATGDGTTDDWYAIQSAITESGKSTGNSTGGGVFIPKGTYRLSKPLVINRRVVLKGEGGCAESGATTLVFDPGVSGIKVAYYVNSDQGWGDWSEISDLTVRGSGAVAGCVGITLKARARLRNVGVGYFTSHGIEISGSDGDNPITNANNWMIDYCRVAFCGGYGCYVRGSDSNAGTAIGLDCSNNGLGGILDGSFLGNTWVGCHTAANNGPCYETNPGSTCYAVFLGCYSEVAQPKAKIYKPGIWFGGDAGAGFDLKISPIGTIHDGEAFHRVMSLDRSRLAGIPVDIQTYLGLGDGKTAFAWKASDEPAPFGVTRGDPFGAAWKGWWVWAYNTNVNYASLAMAGPKAKFRGDDAPPGLVGFPNGFVLGDTNGARHTRGPAPPTSGVRYQNDIHWNTNCTPGGYVGWVCTNFGTPGTWKPFGKIEV